MYKAFLNFKRIYVFFLKLIKKNMPLWKKNRKCQFSRYVLTLNVHIKSNVDSRRSFFTTMRIPILKSLPHFSVYSFLDIMASKQIKWMSSYFTRSPVLPSSYSYDSWHQLTWLQYHLYKSSPSLHLEKNGPSIFMYSTSPHCYRMCLL